jgi:hypothetical protein
VAHVFRIAAVSAALLALTSCSAAHQDVKSQQDEGFKVQEDGGFKAQRDAGPSAQQDADAAEAQDKDRFATQQMDNCELLARVICGQVEMCLVDPLNDYLGAESIDCQRVQEALCKEFYALPGVDQNPAGTLTFAEDVPNIPCSEISWLPTYSKSPGTLESGSECYQAGQCKSGLCGAADGCGHCLDARATVASLGQPCSILGTEFVRCEPGLTCRSIYPDPPVCEPARSIGAPCEPQNCDLDTLTCVNNVCVPAVNLSDDCDPAADSCSFYYGLHCDPSTLKCVRQDLRQRATGESCGGMQNEGLCDEIKDYCRMAVAGSDGPGVCTPYVPLGKACDEQSVCASMLPCIDGVCTASFRTRFSTCKTTD